MFMPPSLYRSAWVLTVSLCLAGFSRPARADEEKWIELSSGEKALEAWQAPTGDWQVVGGVELDKKNPKLLVTKPGKGILVNGPKGRIGNLLSKQKLTDLECHVEFLIPKRSNSGVKCVGLYEIQIFDSHGVKEPTGADCGGIYPRGELEPNYHTIDKGFPPLVNAAKPAGEWQSLDIVFRAPRFDAQGKKTANACFVKVVLNDRLVQQNVEVPSPTGAAWRLEKEIASGPLMLQGDHGPVAFRNVRLRPLPREEKQEKP